ncbi:MAG: DUF2808 domain-containing protein, partial [Cyanobacteria bacterium P01_F01_bin.4]
TTHHPLPTPMLKLPLLLSLFTSALATPLLVSLDPPEINALAKDSTVRVNGQSPGSGVIFKKQGDTYYVLTAKHVVETPDEYEIVTPDEQVYPLDYDKIHPVTDTDLAVAEFNSEQAYPIAALGDSDQVTEGDSVFIAGWPQSGEAIPYIYQFISGNISGLPPRPLPGGYGLIYTNTARQGMSGGPVFDNDGDVVGIHGRAEGKEIYLPNSDFDSTIVRDGFSLGVPINVFLTQAAELPIEPETLPTPAIADTSPVYFNEPLRLTHVSVPTKWQFRESEYLFNINLPAEAVEPLQEIVFIQIEGADYPSYSIRETHAFEGGDRDAELNLSLVANDTDERTMTVVFDPPVEPGRQVTVALKAHRNPRDGIYLYRVVAYPPGASGRGQRIGTGRLSFYEQEPF